MNFGFRVSKGYCSTRGSLSGEHRLPDSTLDAGIRIRLYPGLIVGKLLVSDTNTGRKKAIFNHSAVCLLQRCEKTDIQRLMEACGVRRETEEDNIMIHAKLAELYVAVRDIVYQLLPALLYGLPVLLSQTSVSRAHRLSTRLGVWHSELRPSGGYVAGLGGWGGGIGIAVCGESFNKGYHLALSGLFGLAT